MLFEFGRKINGISQPINHIGGGDGVILEGTVIVGIAFVVWCLFVVIWHIPGRKHGRQKQKSASKVSQARQAPERVGA